MPDFAVIHLNAASGNYEFIKGPNVNQTFTAVDGTAANSAACLSHNINGKYVAFPVAGPSKGIFETSFESPTNTNIVYTAKTAGVAGNSIRVRYVVSGNNTPLSVSVSTNDITVNLATNGSGVPTSTADQVKAAVIASGPANALVDVADAAGEDGTGVIPSGFDYTNLQYGSSGEAIATIVEQVETTNSSPTTY
jgi:hypothetical protein